jgi:phosphatidylserine/phosphatidylglycerophosphate/cardiolipin synthase-like enzyme/membrane protein DedA with SNARE-associated domain
MAMAALDQKTDRPDTAGFLEPGTTCWRVAPADRAALLIDGAAYYGALRSAILKARRSITILGWDIDSRARLCPPAGAGTGPEAADAPATLGELLAHVVALRPRLEIRLLLWNYSILYAAEREPLQSLTLDWNTPRQVQVCFDDVLPLGASHHQKVAVIDDKVAFCGGLDVTSRRWDTPAHEPCNPDRVDPRGAAYPPFHDVQMVVDGEAAQALGELARERWTRATGRIPPAPDRHKADRTAVDPWPDGVVPDFGRVEIGIARTLAPFADQPAVREVEELCLRSIARARRTIYIENQYLSADRVADALCRRLAAEPSLAVVIVAPKEPKGWLEARSMGAGRARFRRCLDDAGVADRVRLVHPFIADGDRAVPIMVHAKLMIVDDDLLRVGSANLNNRSMGFDSECDLAIEARGAADRRTIAGLRDRLLAEHLGVEPAAVAAASGRHGSLIAAIDHLRRPDRGLAPIADEDAFDDEISRTIRPLADPERPVDADALKEGIYGSAPARSRFGRIARLAAVAGALLALVLLWQVTPLADLADPVRLAPRLDAVAGEVWAPFALVAAYVIGGFLVFPVTVLIALTAITFGLWPGLAYASAGALLSAAATFQAGQLLGRGWLGGLMGPRTAKVSRQLARQGILSILVLRLAPVAPFTLVNLVAGASRVRFRDYMIGTVMGMAPGLILMTALGDRLRRVWEDPSWGQIMMLILVAALWLGLSVALQRVVSRRRR